MSGVLQRTGRPLAAIAHPAAGRDPQWCVLFGTVHRGLMSHGARRLTAMLEQHAGPTRCSPVIVQPALDEHMAGLYLASPVCRHITADVAAEVLASLRDAGPGAVLLIAHCRVLWRQNYRQVVWA